jgi:hypothetical protein
VPDTGSLRGDLLEIARRRHAFLQSREGRVLSRMLNAEGAHPDLAAITRSLRQAHEIVPRAVVERAKGRGELCRDVDPSMFVTLFYAGCAQSKGRPVSTAMRCTRDMIDLLLSGALRRAPSRRSA